MLLHHMFWLAFVEPRSWRRGRRGEYWYDKMQHITDLPVLRHTGSEGTLKIMKDVPLWEWEEGPEGLPYILVPAQSWGAEGMPYRMSLP